MKSPQPDGKTFPIANGNFFCICRQQFFAISTFTLTSNSRLLPNVFTRTSFYHNFESKKKKRVENKYVAIIQVVEAKECHSVKKLHFIYQDSQQELVQCSTNLFRAADSILESVQKIQSTFLSKIQNRISEKTRKKILLLYGKISRQWFFLPIFEILP